MTTKYTPGPWKAHVNSSWSEQHLADFGKRKGHVIVSKKKDCIASIIGIPSEQQEVIDANARLIERAPELLDQLHDVCKLLRIYSHSTEPSLTPENSGVDANIYATAVETLRKLGIEFDTKINTDKRDQ